MQHCPADPTHKTKSEVSNMKVQPAAFLRTTLPLGIDQIDALDSGRYHSIWLPDHMVSFWPDSIWSPEFTDLATVSPSPHRHLDAMAVASAAAVLTKNVPIATSVVDTVRRHPSMLAQTSLTIDHLSQGRFILGLGSGETENTVPYGFDFARPVSRFEEAIQVIRLLWESDGSSTMFPQPCMASSNNFDSDGAESGVGNLNTCPFVVCPPIAPAHFRLAEESPLIDQGTATHNSLDFNQVSRPQGAASDPGAFENSLSQSPPRPPILVP